MVPDLPCNAVLLSPFPFEEVDVESFQAFLLDSQFVVPVRCQVGITEFATGQDEHGTPLTFYDGEAHHPDLATDAISTAQNEVFLQLNGDIPSISGPARSRLTRTYALLAILWLSNSFAQLWQSFQTSLQISHIFARLRKTCETEQWHNRPPPTQMPFRITHKGH